MNKFVAALLSISIVSAALPGSVPASTFPAAEVVVELPDPGQGLELELSSVSDAIFSVSSVAGGISINGFSEQYLSSLSEEEKQNITITIPASYGGSDVVAVGDRAFLATNSKYAGCKFTGLDFTQAVNLKTIGQFAFYQAIQTPAQVPLSLPDGVTAIQNSAFYNCSGFTGDLILPDSIESIADMAFDGCTGLDGTLKLPENEKYTAIAKQLVYHCNFTGELVIPENITQIGSSAFREIDGFTGALALPDNITEIGGAAFSGCTGFTGELKLPQTLTTLGNQAFKSCSGFTGVLTLPDGMVSVGSEAFHSCSGLETVYLPDNTETVFTNGSAFNYCSAVTAIVCPNQAIYESLSRVITNSAAKKLLGYPVSIRYDQQTFPALERLYGRPLNLEKEEESGCWKVNTDFVFPEPEGEPSPGYEVMWSFTENGQGVVPSSLVQGTVLYQSMSLTAPVITQHIKGVSKAYDGTPFSLEIDAQHPLNGNGVTLYYDWHKVNHYTGGRVQWSKDNTYTVQNVADSAGGDDSWYQVTVYAYKKGESSPYFSSGEYYFDVNITKGIPRVLVEYSKDALVLPCDLPELTLAEESTPGTVSWEPGQEVVLGKQEYYWSFIPEDAENYDTLRGSVFLTGVSDMQIKASAGKGGSISPEGMVAVPYGTNQSFTITPEPGYEINQVLADGEPVFLTDSVYTFENVTKEHTIEVTFQKTQYRITAAAGEGGTISPAGETKVEYGGRQVFTLTPDAGYEVGQVLVNHNPVEWKDNTYTIENITADHTVEVTFQRLKYDITAVAAEGGVISPSGKTAVEYGAAQTFTLEPEEGYEIDQLLVDGSPVGWENNAYRFENVTAAHTIEARFKKVQYSIAATAGDGGTISPAGETRVEHGKDQVYTILPQPGYEVEQILVDGEPVPISESPYTFSFVTANHTIAVHFKKVLFTITAETGEGGTVLPGGTVEVPYGASQEFVFTPSEGYHLVKVLVDGVQAETKNNRYTFELVQGNHKIYALFEKDTLFYNIQSTAGMGGAISPSGETSVAAGGAASYVIQPEEGYQIREVLVDGQPVMVVDGKYTFEQVLQNHTIEAVFEKVMKKYQVVFHENGGRGTMPSLQMEEGHSIALPVNRLVYDGYRFVGWALEPEGPVVYGNQALLKMQQNDVDLYAVWEPKDESVKWTVSGSVSGGENRIVFLINSAGETLGQYPVNADGRFSFEAGEGTYTLQAQSGDKTDIITVIIDRNKNTVIPAEIYLNLGPVKTEVKSDGEISAISSEILLKGLTEDSKVYPEAEQKLVSERKAEVKFQMNISQTAQDGITSQERESIDAAGPFSTAKDPVFLRVNMNKVLRLNDTQEQTVTSVAELEKPVPVTFVLPERFENKTVTHIIQTYQTSNGETISEILPVLAYENRTITVETNHFGLITILSEATYTVSFMDGATVLDTVKAVPNQPLQPPNPPVKSGYTFLGWYTDREGTAAWNFEQEITADLTLYAGWQKKASSGGGVVLVSYAVRYDAGEHGTLSESIHEKVVSGNSSNRIPEVHAEEGYRFIGWSSDGETIVRPEQVKIYKNTVFTALYEQVKETVQKHKSYIQGDGDSFSPELAITRAETAMMFYRVLDLEAIEDKVVFSDVDNNAWYAEAILALASNGILNGYECGVFRPEGKITRAEFAAVAARAGRLNLSQKGQNSFTDLPDSHWAYGSVSAVAQAGWITGYPDGAFKPEKQITRGEAVKILNAMLSRTPDQEFIAAHEEMNPFKDVEKSHWAYYEILEAAITHDYVLKETESWVSIGE